MDARKLEDILLLTFEKIYDLAKLSADMDDNTIHTKLAIVGPNNLFYVMGQLYESFRSANQRSTKKVSVFRSMEEAIDWIEEK